MDEAGKAGVEVAKVPVLKAMLVGLLRPHLPVLVLALLLLTAQSVVILLQPWLAGELSGRLLHGRVAFVPLLWLLLVKWQRWQVLQAGKQNKQPQPL